MAIQGCEESVEVKQMEKAQIRRALQAESTAC